jgi:hypothetical protein
MEVKVEPQEEEDHGHYFYNRYYGGGWVQTDTEEEPMELPEDHPDAAEDSADADAAGGDGADPALQEEVMQKMVVIQLH